MIVGSQDILTPVGDSEELAELIPGAELVVIRGAAHGFMVEAFRPFNEAVLEFLDRVTNVGSLSRLSARYDPKNAPMAGLSLPSRTRTSAGAP